MQSPNLNYFFQQIVKNHFDSCLMFLTHMSEKAMAPYSSTLAWKIPWMEEPGRLQPTGLLRVGHDWATSLSLFTFLHWRRKWQPTTVFLPGDSRGWRSLVGCCLWGRTELDTTEATQQQQQSPFYYYFSMLCGCTGLIVNIFAVFRRLIIIWIFISWKFIYY